MVCKVEDAAVLDGDASFRKKRLTFVRNILPSFRGPGDTKKENPVGR